MTLICIGKNIFVRIHSSFGYMQILQLIMNLINLIWQTKQLIIKNNAVCNGYYIVSELNDFLNSGYKESNLESDNRD